MEIFLEVKDEVNKVSTGENPRSGMYLT